MKRFFAIISCVIFLVCYQVNSGISQSLDLPTGEKVQEKNPAINKLTRKEKAEGWQLLYDGKSTKGWHVYLNKSDGSAWKSIDGTLMLDPSQKQNGKVVGGGDIVTDAVYENFHLVLEWKVAQNANSGIIFLVQEDKKYEWPWLTGPEMQVLDNAGHPDAKIISHRAGDLYDLISCSRETVKPFGEWNKAEIKYDQGKLDLYLNNEKVVSTTMHDENWKQMVAKSKFKRMADFANFTSGRIALQDHGDQIWFRNIKIKKL